MLEVGLDQVLYEDLKQSYQNLNVTLNSPIPQLTEAEKEGLYHIYKDKEYFKTLRYPQSDIKEWLEGAANETLEDLGVSYDLKDEVYMLWSEQLDSMTMELEDEDENFFDFFTLFFGVDDELHGVNEW